MNDQRRREMLLGIALVPTALAVISVFLLSSQLDGFERERLTLRSPPSDQEELTQTLTTFEYLDEEGLKRTLDLQVQFPAPQGRRDDVEEGSLYDKAAAAASFRTQTTMVVLSIAFLFAAVVTGVVACQSVFAVSGQWRSGSALWAAVLLGVCGAWFVNVDPVGPMVSHDISFSTFSGLLVDLGLDKPLGRRLSFVSWVIGLTGVAAGVTIGLVLHFLYWSVGKNLLGGQGDPYLLWRRKRYLGTVVTLASVALSLGIGMIMAFLGWGADFLDDASRPAVEELAKAGGSYWGGMLTIFTLTTVGYTAFLIHDDIHEAAMSWAVPERERLLNEVSFEAAKRASEAEEMELPAPPSPPDPPEQLSLALDWKKKNDLDFDPLKTTGTVVAALGPVLTSILVPALGSGLA